MNDVELIHGDTVIIPSWIVDNLKKQEENE